MSERGPGASSARKKQRLARELQVRVGAARPADLEVVDVGADFALFEWTEGLPEAQMLTGALREVLDRILRGESNAQIAKHRGTSVRTVDNQVATLLQRFGARSRVDLVRVVSRGAR